MEDTGRDERRTLRTLWRYVVEGPDAGGDSIRKRMFGFYLWWETWAMVAVLLVALVVLYNAPNPFSNGRIWGFLVGTMTAITIDAVTSDKYGI